MNRRSDWNGLLSSVERPIASETVARILQNSDSGAAAFRATAKSGKEYWIKMPHNPQGAQSTVTDRIISVAGRILGAPVRPVALIEIPPNIASWEYARGSYVYPSVGHASEHLPNSIRESQLLHVESDDNRTRHAFLMGLWDWCMGTDEQWLYSPDEDMAVWSFDHGLWLTGETGWNTTILTRVVDWPWELDCTIHGVDPTALHNVANRLEMISADECIAIAASVPSNWGTIEQDLETVAWLLYRRRKPVANRLRVSATRA
jgi:hypothetical protein